MLEAIKVTAVLVAGFAITTALRRSSAALRHMIWTVAMLCLLLLPLLSRIVPAWHPVVPVVKTAVAPSAKWGGLQATTALQRGLPEPQPKPLNWAYVAFAIWAAGAILLTTRLAIGIMHMRRLLKTSRAPESPDWTVLLNDLSSRLGVRRPILLAVSDSTSTPMTWGVLRPVILLPASARDWTADRRRVVLLHELVHIRRCDHLTYLAARLARALYWFHPLIWPAAACFRKEQEHACDDAVLRLGARGPDYAQHLVELARGLGTQLPCPAALAMAQSNLESRIKAMLNPKLNRQSITKAAAAALVLAAICIIVPLASIGAPQAGSAQLAGVIYDASGAVVPGAAITVTNLDTKNKDTVSSNAAGEYAFRSLRAGRYLVEVMSRGFAAQKKEILLEAGTAQVYAAKLDIGSISETLTVVATATHAKPAVRSAAPQRIRVGGNVQATRLVYQAKPSYPDAAKEQGIEGVVIMRAVIGVDGGLLSLEPISTQADPLLVQAAMAAVSQWRYQPTLLNGAPVEVATQITVNFRLAQ